MRPGAYGGGVAGAVHPLCCGLATPVSRNALLRARTRLWRRGAARERSGRVDVRSQTVVDEALAHAPGRGVRVVSMHCCARATRCSDAGSGRRYGGIKQQNARFMAF